MESIRQPSIIPRLRGELRRENGQVRIIFIEFILVFRDENDQIGLSVNFNDHDPRQDDEDPKTDGKNGTEEIQAQISYGRSTNPFKYAVNFVAHPRKDPRL